MSGLKLEGAMPVIEATVATRPLGTRFHRETAAVLIPHAFAMRVTAPRLSIISFRISSRIVFSLALLTFQSKQIKSETLTMLAMARV